jgi:hypothetical protein
MGCTSAANLTASIVGVGSSVSSAFSFLHENSAKVKRQAVVIMFFIVDSFV